MGRLLNVERGMIHASATLQEAMQSLNDSTYQIVLVVDDDKTLVGTLTDGDIRRSLLAGHTLQSLAVEAMNRSPKTGFSTESRSVWEARMRHFSCHQLPILDESGRLEALFVLSSWTSQPHFSNPVVLMLGGLGTRLRPLTENIPKPMLKVGGKPIVETIFEQFVEQGFSRFYFCINYLGHHIREYFGDGSQWNVSITYVEENERMGTAGALSLLPETPNESVIVMNGDLLTKVDFAQLMKHHQSTEALATICTREYTHQIPYGVIEVDSDEVQSIVEKPVTSHQVSAGVYALSPEAIQKIPNNTFYDMPTLVEDLMKDSLKVTAFPITEYWLDIGNPTDFNRAQDDFTMHF